MLPLGRAQSNNAARVVAAGSSHPNQHADSYADGSPSLSKNARFHSVAAFRSLSKDMTST